MRPVFTFLLLLSGISVNAQKVKLKREIGANELKQIDKLTAQCIDYTADLQLSFNSNNLYSNRNIKPDKPAKLESIIELEKNLTGKDSDAEIYSAMASIYSRLKMNDQAEVNRNKAIERYNSLLASYPDSVGVLNELAIVYTSASRFAEAKDALRKAMNSRPKDITCALLMPMVYIFGGELDSTYANIQNRIVLFPNNHSSYIALPIYYFYKVCSVASQLPHEEIVNLKVESIIDMKLLKDYYESDKSKLEREYLYWASYQTVLSTFLFFKVVANKDFDPKNVKFNIKGDEREKLLELRNRFEGYASNKEINDKFYPNRVLGNLCIILDEPKQAIPYLKKAISAKPLSKSKLMDNASDDYDNLITCHFILKDTVSCEKVLLEKVKICPAIDPLAIDHQHLGDLYFVKKKYALAKQYYESALKLDDKNTKVITALAALHLLEGNKKEANQLINTAYKIDRNAWEIFYLSGMIALKDQDAKNAFDLLSIAHQLSENEWIKKDVIDEFFESQ